MMVDGIPEPVERVTSPDQLRLWTIVYVKPCQFCGRVHRGTLQKLVMLDVVMLDVVPVWLIYPKTFKGCPARQHGICAAPSALALGSPVYRVIVDLSEPADEEQVVVPTTAIYDWKPGGVR